MVRVLHKLVRNVYKLRFVEAERMTISADLYPAWKSEMASEDPLIRAFAEAKLEISKRYLATTPEWTVPMSRVFKTLDDLCKKLQEKGLTT